MRNTIKEWSMDLGEAGENTVETDETIEQVVAAEEDERKKEPEKNRPHRTDSKPRGKK